MSTSYEQKTTCKINDLNDGAPEQKDDQPPRSSSIDDIDAVAEGIEKVTLLDSSTDLSEVPKETCANCAKEEDEDNNLKFCGACKLVKYCSAACQRAHRPLHKRECKQRVAELHDEALFKDVEPDE